MEVTALRVNTYDGLLRELDRRRRELGMRMADVDAKSGVQDGYAAKLFVGIRRFGEMSLPSVLGALDVDLVVLPRKPAEAAPERGPMSATAAERVERRALPVTGEM
jgi:hypothetical protein